MEYEKARYANLRVCGSVWTCPVCAAKISEHRKKEIETAAAVHTEAGGFMYMVTYTFSHSRNDNLATLLGDGKQKFGLSGALQRLRDSRGYKKLLEQIDHIGLVRNLEVTHGEANGWHPHLLGSLLRLKIPYLIFGTRHVKRLDCLCQTENGVLIWS